MSQYSSTIAPSTCLGLFSCWLVLFIQVHINHTEMYNLLSLTSIRVVLLLYHIVESITHTFETNSNLLFHKYTNVRDRPIIKAIF